MKVNIKEVNQFKETVSDKFFTVEFIKKDGTIRQMNARLGVTKHLQGGELKYSPNDLGYVTVYDVKTKGYRTINLNTLTSLKVNGITYNVE